MKSEELIVGHDSVGNRTGSSLFGCRPTLPKRERMDSRKLIERLFCKGGSQSASVYPVRIVYMLADKSESEGPQAQMLVSVSKRHFKRAVKRNRVKRQVREAYRHNKQFAIEAANVVGKNLYMAFIWQADRLYTSEEVTKSVKTLLQRMNERLCR